MPTTRFLFPSALFAIAVAMLAGCGAPAVYRDPRIGHFDLNVATTHKYLIKVSDTDGKPITGAAIEWSIDANGKHFTQTGVTGADGANTLTLTIDPTISRGGSSAEYSSVVKYVVRYEDSFPKFGTLAETSYRSASGGRDPAVQTGYVTLVKPIDYLSRELAEEKQYAALRKKVLSFLTVIRLESILNKADVKLHGIGVQDFKGRRYLTVALVSDNIFNSLKLNRYEIGRQVFDETVRKTLNPLNDKISDLKSFYGYNIVLETGVKSFTDEHAVREALRYEFMMPQSSVRSYKEKDISGQRLIDESVVLLNDERIDLKLQ